MVLRYPARVCPPGHGLKDGTTLRDEKRFVEVGGEERGQGGISRFIQASPSRLLVLYCGGVGEGDGDRKRAFRPT